MSRIDAGIHQRRSIRLKGWDYRGGGAYFVTIVTRERKELFGHMIKEKVLLSEFGSIVASQWVQLASQFNVVQLDEFVVMPNHIHGVIWIADNDDGRGEASRLECDGEKELEVRHGLRVKSANMGMPHPYAAFRLTPGSLGAIIGSFKSVAARRINKLRQTPGKPAWQLNFYERIIRNDRELNAIREYIQCNPMNWKQDSENSHK